MSNIVYIKNVVKMSGESIKPNIVHNGLSLIRVSNLTWSLIQFSKHGPLSPKKLIDNYQDL